MKTFLTLCTFAMVSAGIYGFVDMTNDVRHGTMIQYDRGEKSGLKAVTIERLKMAQGFKTSLISQNVENIDLNLKDKVLHAKPEIAIVTPGISVSDFTGENFSRGEPVEIVDADYFNSTLVTDLKVDSSKTSSAVPAPTENAGTDNTTPIAVSLVTSTQPIYTATATADTLKPAEALQPQPIYEYYGRGNPRRVKKIVSDPAPAANTAKTVAKKDDL